MREAQSSPPAHRGARVIGTDVLRILLISQEPNDGEERNQGNCRTRHPRQREVFDGHASSSNRRGECAQMPEKNGQIDPSTTISSCLRDWQASAPRVGLAESSEKHKYSRRFESHPGNPGLFRSARKGSLKW